MSSLSCTNWGPVKSCRPAVGNQITDSAMRWNKMSTILCRVEVCDCPCCGLIHASRIVPPVLAPLDLSLSVAWNYRTLLQAKRQYYFSFVINGHQEGWSFVGGAVGECSQNVFFLFFFFAPQIHHKRLVNTASKKRFVWDKETASSKWKWRHFEVRIQAVNAHFQQFLSPDPLLKTPTWDHCAADTANKQRQIRAILIRRFAMPILIFFIIIFFFRDIGVWLFV